MTTARCRSQSPLPQPQPSPGQVTLCSQVLRKQGFLTFTAGMLSQGELHPWVQGEAELAQGRQD